MESGLRLLSSFGQGFYSFKVKGEKFVSLS